MKSSECWEVTESKGFISIDPEEHSDLLEECWTIKTDHPDHVIRLRSEQFDLEDHFDYLTLTDCADNREIAALTGLWSGNAFYYSGSSCMRVTFSTDRSNVGDQRGWSVYHESVPRSFVLGESTGVETSSTGVFEMTNYAPDTDKVWRFASKSDDVTLRLDVTSFKVEESYDYVIVYDGDDVTAPVLVHLTGEFGDVTHQLPPFWTTGNAVTVRFHSDGGNQLSGFRVDAREIPNGAGAEKSEKGQEIVLPKGNSRAKVSFGVEGSAEVLRYVIRSEGGEKVRMRVERRDVGVDDVIVAHWDGTRTDVMDESCVVISDMGKIFLEARIFSSGNNKATFVFESFADDDVTDDDAGDGGSVRYCDVMTLLICLLLAIY